MSGLKGMKVDKIKFKSEGFKEILNSGGVQGLVETHTSAICARANANLNVDSVGFKYRVFQGSSADRWVGVVYTTDHASCVAETEEKALSRAV